MMTWEACWSEKESQHHGGVLALGFSKPLRRPVINVLRLVIVMFAKVLLGIPVQLQLCDRDLDQVRVLSILRH